MAFVHSWFSFWFLNPFLDFNGLDVGLKHARCRISTSRMSDFYNSDVGFLQVGCRIFTSRMSDFNKSDVRFLQVKCRIFTSRMLNVGFLKSDVGWHL